MAIAERELVQAAEVNIELGAEGLDNLARMVNATSGDQTRQMLTGVCFRNGNAYATDSYIMVKVPFESEGDWQGVEMTIQAKALADACKGAVKAQKALSPYTPASATLMLRADGEYGRGQATLTHAGGTVILPVIEGDFPQCEQLIPDHSKQTEGPNVIALNPWTLGRLFKAMGCEPKSATDAGSKGVKFEMADALKPVKVTPLNPENHARGVVMPVRMKD